mmetsp:Transcript_80893/g.194009  ORF Transcript_80893/g.194009 Transcript_80893/m.194009 type:complete len:205 (-) Transcript_80893:1207-1821(-)
MTPLRPCSSCVSGSRTCTCRGDRNAAASSRSAVSTVSSARALPSPPVFDKLYSPTSSRSRENRLPNHLRSARVVGHSAKGAGNCCQPFLPPTACICTNTAGSKAPTHTGPATRLSSTHAMDRLDPFESLLLKASTGPGFDVPVSTRSLCKGHWSPILGLRQGNLTGEASASRRAPSMPSTRSVPCSSDPLASGGGSVTDTQTSS